MLGFSRFATILIGGILISTITHAANPGSDLLIANLRCESKTSPLGIDIPQPLLSWQLQSPQQGTMQSAYHILVASAPALLSQNRADIWDSGKIQSDQSTNIPYAGPPLASSQTCYWKVEVWDTTGRQAWSSPDEWEMGLLNPSDWKSSWIDFPAAQEKGPATHPSHWKDIHKERHNFIPNRPVQFRKTFTLSKPILRARLYASALGLYDSWINGQKSATPFSPPTGPTTSTASAIKPTTSPRCSPPAITSSAHSSATAGTPATSAGSETSPTALVPPSACSS